MADARTPDTPEGTFGSAVTTETVPSELWIRVTADMSQTSADTMVQVAKCQFVRPAQYETVRKLLDTVRELVVVAVIVGVIAAFYGAAINGSTGALWIIGLCIGVLGGAHVVDQVLKRWTK